MFNSILKNIFTSESFVLISNQRSLYKQPVKKKPWKKFAKGLLLVETGILISCYLVWKRMNNSQEFRFYMKNNWPTILEGYYLNGEMIGNLNTRIYDKECWEKQTNNKSNNE